MSDCILETAKAIVAGARQKAYGTPLENHGRTAALFAAYLGCRVTAEDVCALNILQKLSRLTNGYHEDSVVDVAGYAKNIQLVHEARQSGEME